MNITLYYVPGINETDTPVFDSLANQALFFSEQERYVISSGFYPPYLRNTITLDVSSYSLTSVYNYLSLEYNSKVYYYFIRRKEYVNEDVIRLYVEMDTIQTYMFHAYFIYSHVNRETIERWNNDDTINREYIRENKSNGQFDFVVNKTIYNEDTYSWFLIAKLITYNATDPLSNPETYRLMMYSNKYGLSRYRFEDAGLVYFVPFRNNTIQVSSTGGVETLTSDSAEFVVNTLSSVGCDAGYCIPFNPFAECVETGSGSARLFNFVVNTNFQPVHLGATSHGYNGVGLINSGQYKIYDVSDTLDFQINRALNVDFSLQYCPYLLDTYYVMLTFGDYTARTAYPLEVLESNAIHYYYWANLLNGNVFYNISTSDTTEDFDKYHTIITVNIPNSLEVRSNPQAEYSARSGGKIFKGISSLAASLFIPVSSYNTIVNQYSEWLDVLGSKPHVLRTDTFTSNSLGDILFIYKELRYCNNIIECARYFETYGNHVSKEYTTSLFAINNRYYYDYVQTESLNILIGDKETEDNFINRFTKGLRLWHTTNGVLHAVDSGLEMGQVCIYDNVESKYIN